MIRGRCIFHGIGQGLFHSGVLQKNNGHGDLTDNVFRFVYDCGSLSTSSHVTSKYSTKGKANNGSKGWFGNYVQGYSSRVNKLDLLVLSHLHQDHVNGVVNLPSAIVTLVMPYLTIADRLLQFASEDVDQTPESIDFYLDPITYLRSGDRQIGQIIFIKDSESPEIFDKQQTIFPHWESNDGEDSLELSFSGTLIDIDRSEYEELASNGSSANIKIAKGRITGTVGNSEYFFRFWYPTPSKDTLSKLNDFTEGLRTLAKENNLLSGDRYDLDKLKVFLSSSEKVAELRALYKNVFGKNGLNETSVCLWHGYDCNKNNCEICENCRHIRIRPYWSYNMIYYGDDHYRCWPSTFLTGDQLFTNEDRSMSFLRTFARERTYPSVFQVPHHGSKHNFSLEMLPEHRSLAVLSYGLDNKYGHPAASVREDLFIHGHEAIDVFRLKHFEYVFNNNCHK